MAIALKGTCRGDGGYFFGDIVRLAGSVGMSGTITITGPPQESLQDVLMNFKVSGLATGFGFGRISFSASLGGAGVSSFIEWRTIQSGQGQVRACSLVVADQAGEAFGSDSRESEPLWVRWNESRGLYRPRLQGPIQSGRHTLDLSLTGQWTMGSEHRCAGSGWPGNWTSLGGIDAGRTVTLATDGPVFDLPPGWTVDSEDFNIVDNRWMGSTTLPVVMSQPEPQILECDGREVRFVVRATGEEPLAYQWRRDDQDLIGANEPHLILVRPGREDEGIYECVVSNSLGQSISHPVPLFYCVADIERDGDVDLADFSILQNRMGLSSDWSPSGGDLNVDGDVDLVDFQQYFDGLTGSQ